MVVKVTVIMQQQDLWHLKLRGKREPFSLVREAVILRRVSAVLGAYFFFAILLLGPRFGTVKKIHGRMW